MAKAFLTMEENDARESQSFKACGYEEEGGAKILHPTHRRNDATEKRARASLVQRTEEERKKPQKDAEAEEVEIAYEGAEGTPGFTGEE